MDLQITKYLIKPLLHLTQHIRYELTSLPFGTLLPSVATSYILIPLDERGHQKNVRYETYVQV